MSNDQFRRDVAVIGGCGHVGLPLGIALADRGLETSLYDINRVSVDLVNSGTMPFMEAGADEVLARVIDKGTLLASTDPQVIAEVENVIVVIGTPIDKHLHPEPQVVPEAIAEISDHLRDGQLLILRSTVYPGVTRLVKKLMDDLGLDIDVAFCPERIAEGRAMIELYEFPQIVGARSRKAADRARRLFAELTWKIVDLAPEEAELAKLFTNTWRYIKFATANQLFMIANDLGLDFDRIRIALSEDYPRSADFARAGFTAGPCLLKDTMQLAAFTNNFTLGHAAMMVNEGLPFYIVSRLDQNGGLADKTVGILGMAFKAESDDTRASLSYKLKRILRFRAKDVLCTDPYVRDDPTLVALD